MRPSDLSALSKLYEGDGRSSDAAFADAIQADAPSLRELASEIAGDMDREDGIWGVGWWFPHPGTKRRILISDYLLRAASNVETNLVEAKVHLLELASALEEEDRFIERAIDYDDEGGIQIAMPTRSAAIDDLPRILRDLHIAGFFRAIGSALDCLAAAAVGVLAIPERIQFTDLGRVRAALEKGPGADSAVADLWQPVKDTVAAAAASQPGWLEWTLDYRNTLVHRARPVTMMSLKPEQTVLRHDRPVPHIRTSSATMLARQPRLWDIEVMSSAGDDPVLTEDVRTTLDGVFGCGREMCEEVGVLLASAWAARRADPSLVAQPAKQWPKIPSASDPGFRGFSPGDEPYDPGLLSGAGDLIRRMQASSVLDGFRDSWAVFD